MREILTDLLYTTGSFVFVRFPHCLKPSLFLCRIEELISRYMAQNITKHTIATYFTDATYRLASGTITNYVNVVVSKLISTKLVLLK